LPQPATFRPQGLVTLSAAYSLRAPAGLVSYRQRSWDFRPAELSPPGRYPSRFRTDEPTYRFARWLLPRWAGPPGRGFWALTLPRVPGAVAGLVRQTLVAPLGFSLVGLADRSVARDFARAPPTRLSGQPHSRPAAPWSIQRLRPGPVRHPANRKPDRTTLSGFWHRTPQRRSNGRRSGYWLTSRRVVHRCRPPALLERSPRSAKAAR
jgi:hypothetical protein